MSMTIICHASTLSLSLSFACLCVGWHLGKRFRFLFVFDEMGK